MSQKLIYYEKDDMQPEFVTYDTKQREELLSQTGNFSPGERDAFHKLCQSWQERIPYNRFVAVLDRGDGATASDVNSLMTKLRTDGYGLIRTRVHEGQRTRDAIILTDRFSRRFVSELLDEYFNDLYESVANSLPLYSVITDAFENFPTKELIYIPSDKLAKEYTNPDNPETPLAIESIDNDRLLITRGNLRPCITVSMLKLRYYLTSTTLLELLARYLDTSLIALKKQVNDKDPQVWLAVTRKIVEKRKEIKAIRDVRVDENFFHAAWLLKRLLESQLAEAEQKKREAENRRVDMEAIVMAVKEAPEGWMIQEQLTHTIDGLTEKYGSEIDSFREEFYEKNVHARVKNSLPKIVNLDGTYIHRDRIFTVFLAHFRQAETDLKPYFISQMESQLRSGISSGDTTFVDLDSFDHAILEYIRKQTPLLATMIEKPGVLAEGTILHVKQNKLVKDVVELKQRLAVYFDPETLKPLPLHEWFNLRLLELFETAFERLPIWRRIWIRITGRYESFRGRYISHAAVRAQERSLRSTYREALAAKTSSSEEPARRGTSRSTERTRSTRSTGSARSNKTARTDRGPGGTADSPKRGYSKKQVDSAWQEFGSSIKKKD